LLKDGDIFDLGNGEKLQVIFAPGHQPAGIVIYEHKNKGLFINDLVGNYFPDCGAQYCLNPIRSDNVAAVQSLKKILNLPLPVERLYLGHYGICGDPKGVMTKALTNLQALLDMGAQLVREGKPKLIPAKVMELAMPELKKIQAVRGEAEFYYASQELVPNQAKLFAKYCEEKFKKAAAN
jgi:glyoxylase-like metal-dependent hydrolase (beta-lactamase superfamily II)